MNHLLFFARFGHGGGGAVLGVLFIALLVIAAVAIFSSARDTGADKK